MEFYQYKVLSARVIDGDTLEATVDLGFHTHCIERFRLARIDAPELASQEGRAAQNALRTALAASTDIAIRSVKTDKYGRWLAELYVNGENINDWLLLHGFAKRYP